MGRFINPFTDFGFHRIFGQEIHKELLIDFLNQLLKGEREVRDIRIKNPLQTPELEEGRCTVGTLLQLEHLAATPLGGTVTAETELVEIDRRRLVFAFTVRDAAGEVARGRHERFVVEAGRFVAKAEARSKNAEP